MDNWLILSLGLFAVGLLFTAIEVVVPSGGLLGLIALASLLGSIASAYQLSGLAALIMGSVEAISVPAVIVFAFKILPKTALGKGLFLSPPQQSASSPSSSASPTDSGRNPFAELQDREGIVVAKLRPSGTAEIDGRRVSVVSNGETIEAGRRVRVVLVEGNRVVVECIKS